jgi:shikimate dehydrogenase
VIRGTTTLIAHFGDPIAPVKSPMIYNPYFESAGIDAVVVPMGVRSADYPAALKAVFQFTNYPRRARDYAAQGGDRRPHG